MAKKLDHKYKKRILVLFLLVLISVVTLIYRNRPATVPQYINVQRALLSSEATTILNKYPGSTLSNSSEVCLWVRKALTEKVINCNVSQVVQFNQYSEPSESEYLTILDISKK
jgi:hypothetical protein